MKSKTNARVTSTLELLGEKKKVKQSPVPVDVESRTGPRQISFFEHFVIVLGEQRVQHGPGPFQGCR